MWHTCNLLTILLSCLLYLLSQKIGCLYQAGPARTICESKKYSQSHHINFVFWVQWLLGMEGCSVFFILGWPKVTRVELKYVSHYNIKKKNLHSYKKIPIQWIFIMFEVAYDLLSILSRKWLGYLPLQGRKLEVTVPSFLPSEAERVTLALPRRCYTVTQMLKLRLLLIF